MFGYVVPLKSELKVRELAQYNAYYCGLCVSIGRRFGQCARLTLNYDSTFLALLLSALGEPQPCEPRACAYKPLHKKRLMAPESELLTFAADWNVALAWHKLADDWADERKPVALIGKTALSGAAKRIARERPALVQPIAEGIAALTELERSACDELDAPADCFGQAMRRAVLAAPIDEARSRTALAALFYNMGKWIYLADAWEDRARDEKTGAYNVFNICNADAERAGFLMHFSLNEAIKAYELLELRANRGILDNIIYDGCAERTQRMLGGKHEQSL